MARFPVSTIRDAEQLWRRSLRARVLVAEDDAALRLLVVWTLLNDGHEVYEAAAGDELLQLLGSMSPHARADDRVDLIVLDHQMPGISGLAVAQKLRREGWYIPLILVTAFPSEALVAEARRLGVRVLSKPFALGALSEIALTLLLTAAADRRSKLRPPS
jgi:CheY-like chemotaxis protein